MKILKYVLGAVALLAIAFFAIGMFTPSFSYSTEVEVNKPLPEAWAVFSDETKLDQWITGMKSIELLEGEKDKVGAKHKIVMVVEEGGAPFEMTETLTAFEKEKQYAMHFDAEGMEQEVDVQFSAKDENTTVIHVDSKVMGKGMAMRSMFALMQGSFQQTSDEMYGRLKGLIEANTTDYFPAPPPVEADADTVESEEGLQ